MDIKSPRNFSIKTDTILSQNLPFVDFGREEKPKHSVAKIYEKQTSGPQSPYSSDTTPYDFLCSLNQKYH